jgi:hypothetical protein
MIYWMDGVVRPCHLYYMRGRQNYLLVVEKGSTIWVAPIR